MLLSNRSRTCSLDGNDIGPAGAKAFADVLADNTTLLSLKFDRRRCSSFPMTVSMCSLMYNDIGDQGGAHLAALLHKNTTIELGSVAHARHHCFTDQTTGSRATTSAARPRPFSR